MVKLSQYAVSHTDEESNAGKSTVGALEFKSARFRAPKSARFGASRSGSKEVTFVGGVDCWPFWSPDGLSEELEEYG
jgi:hypothetical protein